jgi:site-specific DNA-methyltransferase (adenine-specific)
MLLVGDCVEEMKKLASDSVDAIVTDPPYGLEFMGKAWDGFGTPLGFQTWSEQWAREALRVLKPGGHLLAFGGTRMYHRLAAGIEDAGFEIRDTLMWVYGSGFPKSLDVSKAIDKAAGAERKVIGSRALTGNGKTMKSGFHQPDGSGAGETAKADLHYFTAPSTEAAKRWQGWGTALKPAVEPIVLARKPLIGTVAENVLTHGTGALNIDACRIGTDDTRSKSSPTALGKMNDDGWKAKPVIAGSASGRWAANLLLDEEAAALLDEQSGTSKSSDNKWVGDNNAPIYGKYEKGIRQSVYSDTGGASRFFYVAKAGRAERNKGLDGLKTQDAHKWNGNIGKRGIGDYYPDGTPRPITPERNTHPTVKPVALMKYLIRLVVPKGGIVLDPFMGSGTTAVAAIEEGVNWIGCEREPGYVEIAKARIAAAQPGLGLNVQNGGE